MKPFRKAVIGEINGEPVDVYTLETKKGHRLSVMSYGATVLEYTMPDRNGVFENVVVRYDTFEEYIDNAMKLGAAIGPVAGRIANGEFKLNGMVYHLPKNNNGNHLHGGSTGFDSAMFKAVQVCDDEVVFYLHRQRNTGGYPGELRTWIHYRIFEDGQWRIRYVVKTDTDTLVNPTNHSYFNLNGRLDIGVSNHHLTVNATGYTELNDVQIPTGKIDRDADFLKALQKGENLSVIFKSEHPQIQAAGGLDHAFVLNPLERVAGIISCEQTGRQLIIETTSPAMVVYTANGYDDKTFFGGKKPVEHVGIAIETQILPDAINQKSFGDTILRLGHTFESETTYTPCVY
ncbi:galactose mutarotase [Granulicatella sp. zg-ZJ]|uniref:aldose epimerase family protein n=1 Tax=Granulicatella sp. zg-ZJ TaxID=2678504 RepID=UPI0013D43B5E|nr:aldose epimerase family protein [Granulicatella sp. zg-ZJ]NEW62339.1 galactose mutarotase [Granulicatella sp. zg-ZJ]